MRINTNVSAMSVYHQLMSTGSRVAKSVAKLSSGNAIVTASDNAAGLCISEKMRAQIRGLGVAEKNTQMAVSMVQTAEGALSGMSNILQRMNELAVQASSDTYHDEDRKAIDAEFSQLRNELDDIAAKTTFNKKNLLDGSLSGEAILGEEGASADKGLTIQVGQNMGDTMTISIGHMDAFHMGVAHAGVANQGSAQDALTSVKSAIDAVSSQRASLGAMKNMLNDRLDLITTTSENLSAADSRIRDVDFAKELTELTTANLLQQVNTAMLAQANSEPESVLTLLKSI